MTITTVPPETEMERTRVFAPGELDLLLADGPPGDVTAIRARLAELHDAGVRVTQTGPAAMVITGGGEHRQREYSTLLDRLTDVESAVVCPTCGRLPCGCMSGPPTVDPELVTLAQGHAAGLRAMADMLDAHPELAEAMRYSTYLNVGLAFAEDKRAALAAWIRAAKAHGATVKKSGDKYVTVELRWGRIGFDVFASREQVCERVVTGTETVTTSVPDPDALAAVPTVEVTETVETVEWRCTPLLAAPEGREPIPAPSTGQRVA